MKKLLIFLILVIFISCNKKEVFKNEEPIICSNPPFKMFLLINKKSDQYKKLITKEGKFDKENVYFYYKTDENHEERIYAGLGVGGGYEGLDLKNYAYFILGQGNVDGVFKDKEEVLYLVNKEDKLPIKITGTMTNNQCGTHYDIKKISVNGEKINFENGNTSIVYLVK